MNPNNKFRFAMGGIALCTAAMASAQSAVQLYGQVGLGLSYNAASGGGTKRSVTDLRNNLMSSSLFGFQGQEDLGGGASAIFRLEAGLAPDTGAVGGPGAGGLRMFNRQSYVGLGTGSHTVTLGRQFHAGVDRVIRTLDVTRVAGSTVQVAPLALFGVNKFVGNDNRVDNSIKYRYSNPGVVETAASYGMSEKVSGTDAPAPAAGASYSFDLARTTKDYNVGVMYIHYDAPTGFATGGTPAKAMWALGGSVQLGAFRPYLSYFDSSFDSTTQGRPSQRNTIVDLGLQWVPTGTPITITGAYYHDKGTDLNGVPGRDGTKQTFVLAGFYALSKRTELYTAYYQNRFSGGYKLEPVNQVAMNRTATQDLVQGVSTGIRHYF